MEAGYKIELHPRRIFDVPRFCEGDGDSQSRVLKILDQTLGGPPKVELTQSCTAALDAAAIVLGVDSQAEVIVPAFTFPSSANGFVNRGARIRFADIDPLTGNISPASIARLLNKSTKAIVCMHYGGVACQMDEIQEIASEYEVEIVEDNAHGLFGSYKSVPLGRFGSLGALSFHKTKNISCFDGGALIINDPGHIKTASITLDKGTNRQAFNAGTVKRYEWTGVGLSGRLSEVHIRILLSQLELCSPIQQRRASIWNSYMIGLKDWAQRTTSSLPYVPEDVIHPAHLFWIALPSAELRPAFVRWCSDHGIQVAEHFGSLPESRFGRSINVEGDLCPEAACFAKRIVRLPIHEQMSDSDVEMVISTVESFPGTRDAS